MGSNHGKGTSIYNNRMPYFLSAGKETPAGEVVFSSPEIALYNRSALLANESSGCRPGYPDIIEDVDGSIFITETDKTAATVHRVDAKMLELLFGQLSETPKKKKPAAEGLAHTPMKDHVSQQGQSDQKPQFAPT